MERKFLDIYSPKKSHSEISALLAAFREISFCIRLQNLMLNPHLPSPEQDAILKKLSTQIDWGRLGQRELYFIAATAGQSERVNEGTVMNLLHLGFCWTPATAEIFTDSLCSKKTYFSESSYTQHFSTLWTFFQQHYSPEDILKTKGICAVILAIRFHLSMAQKIIESGAILPELDMIKTITDCCWSHSKIPYSKLEDKKKITSFLLAKAEASSFRQFIPEYDGSISPKKRL